jgi:hypothetical protein
VCNCCAPYEFHVFQARNKLLAAAKGQGKFGDAALDLAKALALQAPAVKAVATTSKDKSRISLFSIF